MIPFEKCGLSTQTQEQLNSVFVKYPNIEKIILYGSRAKGNYKIGSDIDLTIIGPKMNLNDLLKIYDEIDDLLLPYKVDLSLFHTIDNPELIAHIERAGIELYSGLAV